MSRRAVRNPFASMWRRAAVAICLSAAASPALAQTWPASAVTMVVPYAAGGNTDIMARLLADSLGRSFGQTVIVENRGGAGGAIGADYVSRAAKDGYTLLFGTTAQIAVAPLVQTVRYDPRKDFTPVSIYGTGPDILAVSEKTPVSNLAELIAYAKAHPGEVNYGSGGVGSIAHLAAALFGKDAGIDIRHVPYKGGSQTVTDLLAGQIEMYLGNASEILPLASSGRIRMLAVSSKNRLPDHADLPTIGETLPGYVIDSWNGLLAPAGTPKAIVDRLEAETIKAAQDPAVIERMRKLGIFAAGTTSREFAATIETDAPLYREAVKAAGIQTGGG